MARAGLARLTSVRPRGPHAVPDAPDRPRARQPGRPRRPADVFGWYRGAGPARAVPPAARSSRSGPVAAPASTRTGSTSSASALPGRGTELGIPAPGPPLLFAGAADAFEHLPAFSGSRGTTSGPPRSTRRVHVWQVGRSSAANRRRRRPRRRGGDVRADRAGRRAPGRPAGRAGRLAADGARGRRDQRAAPRLCARRRGRAPPGCLERGSAALAAWRTPGPGLARGRNRARRDDDRRRRSGLASAVAVAVVAKTTSLPVGPILSHSLLTSLGLAIGVGAWIVATVAIASRSGSRSADAPVAFGRSMSPRWAPWSRSFSR